MGLSVTAGMVRRAAYGLNFGNDFELEEHVSERTLDKCLLRWQTRGITLHW